MIPDREKKKSNYLAVKKAISIIKRNDIQKSLAHSFTGRIPWEKISKNNRHSCCLNGFHSFRTRSKLELHKRVCKNKDFSDVAMPSKDTKIFEFNQYRKSDKTSDIA